MKTPRVRLSGIARWFGPVAALSGADLELHAGEIHGLLGENGAGKTTLLRILGGAQRPSAGSLELDGERISLRSPRDAWSRGIGLVHQHFSLVPTLSVLENLALGHRSGSGGWRLPYDVVSARAQGLARRTGLDVPLDARVEALSVGDRQRVEILKALLREPAVLALDEPTAVLAPREIESLFALLRELADEGRAVVLVAHKLDEVLAIADRVTVLRGGRTVLSVAASEVDAGELVQAMVGRGPTSAVALGAGAAQARRRPPGAVVASLEDVRLRPQGGAAWALDVVTLSIARGEIVGIAGVEGNGQRELAAVLAGRVRASAGRVSLPPGIGFIPEDRSTEGVIPDFDLTENVALSVHQQAGARRGPLLRWSELRLRAEELRIRYRIRAPTVETAARALSGGNQQRLVVARELAVATDLLVAENPTRGLDVEATAFVHAELERIVASGPEGRGPAAGDAAQAPGVLLVSTDLDEVLALSDRVLTMVRGRLIAVPEHGRTREGVGALMLGAGAPTGAGPEGAQAGGPPRAP